MDRLPPSRARLKPCLAVLLLASPPQQRPGAVTPRLMPQLWNTGLAVRSGSSGAAAGVQAFLVRESDQGRDLNGDGDLDDRVHFLADPVARSLIVVPRAWGSLDFGASTQLGDFLALTVSEADQGLDLNGDGALDDRGLTVVEARTGQMRDLPLAVESCFGAANVLSVRSPFGGFDQNGVLSVYDAVLDRLQPLGLVGDGRVLHTGMAVQYVSERFSVLDLNGDGDQLDTVVTLYDARLDRWTNTGLALLPSSGSDPVALQRGTLLVPVLESAQGADLNGDGDRSDEVLHEFDLASHALRNTGLDGHALIPDDALARSPEAALYFIVAEDGRDQNGDGDAHDLLWFSRLADGSLAPFPGRLASFLDFDVTHHGERHVAGTLDGSTHVLDVRTGVAQDLKLPTFIDLALRASSHLVAATASEELLNQDLDGDGRQESFLLHVHDLQRGTSQTIGRRVDVVFAFAFFTRMAIDGGLVAFASTELPGQDGNGDGDTRDSLVWIYQDDPARPGRPRWFGTKTSIRPHRTSDVPLYPRVGTPWVVWPVLESEQGQDLDQDGTLDDEVLAVLHAPTQRLTFFAAATPNTLAHGELALALAEARYGDLNADGDALDSVLHFVLLP